MGLNTSANQSETLFESLIIQGCLPWFCGSRINESRQQVSFHKHFKQFFSLLSREYHITKFIKLNNIRPSLKLINFFLIPFKIIFLFQVWIFFIRITFI